MTLNGALDSRLALPLYRQLYQRFRQALDEGRLRPGDRVPAVRALAEGEVVGLAGYRELENLLYGRFLYVDDLVVAPARQRDGLGARLLAAVRSEALERGCSHLILDTGLHMPLAQRFYFRQGLLARGLHFAERLSGEVPA